MRCSNTLTGFINFLVLLLSIPILAGGIWLNHEANTTDCQQFLVKPMIILGVVLLIVSIAGIVGACCRVNWLLWVYLLVMFLLIILLFCFTIFTFFVTNPGAGRALAGKGYKEYRLKDYSHWLQKRVTDDKTWADIKSCLKDGKACQSLIDQKTTSEAAFSREKLSPVQSGCCKPLDECGFSYVTPTSWTTTTTSDSTSDGDCKLWNNNQSELCYSCSSCKAGVLQNIKTHWKRIAIVNIIVLVLLLIVYSLGCHAFRNNRADNYNNQWNWKPYR